MDSNFHGKTTATHHQNNHHKPSTSELMSSAKLVAEAAKATLSHESDKVDKSKVAGAAADLLNAASSYGKLEEKSFGKYVQKAENYLYQYHSTTSSGHHSTTTNTTGHTSSHSGGDGHSASGYGDYIKMAEGFLKKN
ncbi:unnamed protein product [Ilex paraguariensis]|uniref:Nodulin-related protein 1 n=1 Tax=Ilex paraguariensis TaxID=185542 RepID=A0ABC8UYL5_9AQUA